MQKKQKSSDLEKQDILQIEFQKEGSNFDSDIWIVSSHTRSAADTPVTFNWPKILLEISERAGGDVYCRVLKSIAGCLLVGIGSRKFAPNTVMNSIVMLRSFFLTLLESEYYQLSLMTPRQLDIVVQKYRINNMTGRLNATATMTSRMNWISLLYRLKKYIGDGLNFEPFTAKHRKRISSGMRERIFWEAPPEPVCLYLLRRSIKIVEFLGSDMVRIHNKYSSAAQDAIASGLTTKKSISRIALAAISNERFNHVLEVPEIGDIDTSDTMSLANLKLQLITACFIVITYTCGLRVSEVRRATSTSIRHLEHSNGRSFDYYFAPRSKRRYTSRTNSSLGAGEDVPWVISPAASEAFHVLREISLPLRQRSDVDSLWLASAGNSFWAFRPKEAHKILTCGHFNGRLNSFADFIRLEEHTGWAGRLHSHMGRKFLARFVAKRDRTYLGDLAVQFSHTTSHSVDHSYAQPDGEYRRVINEELAAELNTVAEALVGCSSDEFYFGGSGAGRISQIKSFIGQFRTSRDVKLLLGQGSLLVPCQWGVCIYRQETSACAGTRAGPNPSNRAPSICKDCSNFIAAPKHSLWWQNYKEDSVRLLKQRNLPLQVKLILENRLRDANNVLEFIVPGDSNDQ